jgi:hypothetical protein
MRFQEIPNRITPMPTCSVNIQPDRVATKPVIEVLQHLEESLSIAAFRLDYSGTAQKRSYPSGNIQSLLMLAGRRNLQPLSNERPPTAKPRMAGKTTFILKNNGFLRTQRFEFFLGSWRISSHRLPLLGDKHDWPALADTRVDASSTGPDGLSVLSQIVVVNGSPESDHPSEHGSIRTSGEIPPSGVLTALQSSVSSGQVAPSASSGLGHLPHLYLPLASSGLCSSGSDRVPQKSSPVVAPQELKGGWQSSCRSKHRVFSRPEPAAVPLTLCRGSQRRFSCLPV